MAFNLGYWECLEQVRTVHMYAKLLEIDQVKYIERVEHWLDRESFLLGNEQWWPKVIPGLFHQQLFNRSVEEECPLEAEAITARWLRLAQPTGAESRTLLIMFVGHEVR